ncbi:hypothetical protein RB2083_3604 [Rhodobacteraceae bacterium HTCC2083]|nr:hypothetical protein RB2083_3604 [Rhodobacteraceae bacterium HTCC2083]
MGFPRYVEFAALDNKVPAGAIAIVTGKARSGSLDMP